MYRGIRDVDGSGCRVRVLERREADGTEWSYELRARPDLFAKPPAPFEWAADTSGTVHLAAALLADLGADAKAMRAVVPYFRRLLSRLPADGFEVSNTFLEAFAYAVAGAVSAESPAPARAAAPPQPGDRAAEPVSASDRGNGG